MTNTHGVVTLLGLTFRPPSERERQAMPKPGLPPGCLICLSGEALLILQPDGVLVEFFGISGDQRTWTYVTEPPLDRRPVLKLVM